MVYLNCPIFILSLFHFVLLFFFLHTNTNGKHVSSGCDAIHSPEKFFSLLPLTMCVTWATNRFCADEWWEMLHIHNAWSIDEILLRYLLVIRCLPDGDSYKNEWMDECRQQWNKKWLWERALFLFNAKFFFWWFRFECPKLLPYFDTCKMSVALS